MYKRYCLYPPVYLVQRHLYFIEGVSLPLEAKKEFQQKEILLRFHYTWLNAINSEIDALWRMLHMNIFYDTYDFMKVGNYIMHRYLFLSNSSFAILPVNQFQVSKFLPPSVTLRWQWSSLIVSWISQRYTYRVLQTIQMKLTLLCVWAERAVLGSAKTALKFKYEI
jgi:hypothetical protein